MHVTELDAIAFYVRLEIPTSFGEKFSDLYSYRTFGAAWSDSPSRCKQSALTE